MAGHVANRCIHPYIKVLAGGIRYFKAPVRLVARDIPVLQSTFEPLLNFIAHLWLQLVATGPVAQHRIKVVYFEEVLFRVAGDGGCATNDGFRVKQFGGVVGIAAFFTRISVLFFGFTVRAGAGDKTVGQEHFCLWVVELLNGSHDDMPAIAKALINSMHTLAVFI